MTRIGVAILCWMGIFIFAIVAGVGIFSSLWIGLILWAGIMAFSIKPFLVSVPEVTGLLTINLFSAVAGEKYYTYGVGIHFRFPWEQVKEGNYINLRTITQQRKENYPSADGPAMVVKWSFQYIPNRKLLPKFIAVDETTINDGIGDVGSSFLSVEIAKRPAIECKTEQADIEKDLQAEFEEPFSRSTTDETVEQFYGIDIVRISLADVDYDERFQQIRTSEQIAARVKGIAKNLQTETKADGTVEKKDIKDKDALNTALIINRDIVKSVQEVEGDPIASLFMAGANAIGGGKKGGK